MCTYACFQTFTNLCCECAHTVTCTYLALLTTSSMIPTCSSFHTSQCKSVPPNTNTYGTLISVHNHTRVKCISFTISSLFILTTIMNCYGDNRAIVRFELTYSTKLTRNDFKVKVINAVQ